MNDEILQLKKRIAELERINAELLRENSALKAKPPKETQQAVDNSTRILQYFFDNPQTLITSQIATRFNLTQSAAQYHLDHLVANGFLTLSKTRDATNATGYTISPTGRAVLTGKPR